MKELQSTKAALKKYFQVDNLTIDYTPISGGDIHSNFELKLSGDEVLPCRLFAKFNSGMGVDVLKTEFESLTLVNELFPDFYPQVLLFDDSGSEGALIMHFHRLISLSGSNAADAGRALAEQHKRTNDDFGWESDNYIGVTPQYNRWTSSWVDFFREQRLLPMLDRAEAKGLPRSSVSRVNEVASGLNEILSHKVIPSLVHGDLWSGNLGLDLDTSKPLFYDPAPYYGDREVDIAMTELFGRQAESFYQAYNEVWPLGAGYDERRAVYNLYHALNHVSLFGLSYESLADECLNQLLL